MPRILYCNGSAEAATDPPIREANTVGTDTILREREKERERDRKREREGSKREKELRQDSVVWNAMQKQQRTETQINRGRGKATNLASISFEREFNNWYPRYCIFSDNYRSPLLIIPAVEGASMALEAWFECMNINTSHTSFLAACHRMVTTAYLVRVWYVVSCKIP